MDYGYSSEIDFATDPRQKEWKKQRKARGFDDTELWNLDVTFARFVVPRLKAFQETYSEGGTPGCFIDANDAFRVSGNAKWQKALDAMIEAFELLSADDFYVDEVKSKKIKKGLKLFARYYQSLWD